MKKAIIAAILLMPVTASAGGLHHAEEWVLKRDGAWIVNFAILFMGLFWIIKRFIVPALKDRTEEISKSLTESENARMEAMKKLSDLEFKIRQFEKESEDIRNDAIAEGEKVKADIIAEAKRVSERILAKAESEIEAEKVKAMERLKREAVELAVSLARDILAKEVKEQDHSKVVEEYLESIKGK